MDNISIVNNCIDNILREFYQMIENELEYIINSPSTVNSIIKYYKITIDADGNYYLVFNNAKIIKEWSNPKDWYYTKLKFEAWCQMGLQVLEPTPIMYVSPK